VKKKSAARPSLERVLDVAERLFAQRGLHAVSLGEVAEGAGVDAALVSDHFGGTRELISAVLERRAPALNRERLERLEELRRAARPGAPTVEAVVRAFTEPLLERCARGARAWKSYFALLAEAHGSAQLAPVMMAQCFDPLLARFTAVLREALPECPPQDIHWGFRFLTAALLPTLAAGGHGEVRERLIPYVAAGFRALCARAQPPPRPGKRLERRARPRR